MPACRMGQRNLLVVSVIVANAVEPAITPVLVSQDDRPQITPFFRQPVLTAWWVFTIGNPPDNIFCFKSFEALAQDMWRSTGVALQLFETVGSEKQFMDNHLDPLITDDLNGACHRTGHRSKIGSAHR